MPNPYKNKIVYNGTTLIDLTGDDVTAADVAAGKYFHLPTGERTVGTATAGSVIITDTQDVHGGTIREITSASVVNLMSSKSITANGTYSASSDSVDGYSSVVVNVSGGGGLVYETGTYIPSSDISKPTIYFTDTHTTRPFFVIMSVMSEEDQSNTYMVEWFISSWYDMFGYGFYVTSTQINYARTQALYKTGSSFSTSAGNVSNLTGNSSTTQMGYYLTNEYFSPYSGSNSQYWGTGRTYKWIAVWAPTS